jgi:hypothetical protein
MGLLNKADDFSFSVAGYLMRRRPHPRSCFFKQAVLER